MKIRKQIQIDKENYLIQNIVNNSREGSRRKLKSLKPESMEIVYNRPKSKRYQEQDPNSAQASLTETIELPTFGDWRNQMKIQRNIKVQRSSRQIVNQLATIVGNDEQPKPLQKNKASNNNQQKQKKRIGSLRGSKNMQLNPIIMDKLVTLKVGSNNNNNSKGENRRKSVGESLSSRVIALNKQFQNFETLDLNLKKIINRKQIFRNLYIKQKQKYEQILKKHNIEEEVDDTEFLNYFR